MLLKVAHLIFDFSEHLRHRATKGHRAGNAGTSKGNDGPWARVYLREEKEAAMELVEAISANIFSKFLKVKFA